MAFLVMLLGFFAFLHLPPMSRLLVTTRDKASVAMGFSFVVTGTMHFTSPERFSPLMPPWLPWHLELIYISGFFELLGAAGLFLRGTRRIAGLGLALLLICVFPANVHLALSGKVIEGLASERWYYWARLPLQIIFIVWAIYCSRVSSPYQLPRRRR